MSANQRAQAAERRRLSMMLRCGASALALTVAATGTSAWAQSTQPGPVQNTQPGSTSVDAAASSQTSPATSDATPAGQVSQSTSTGISDSTSTSARNPPDTTTQSSIVVTGTRAALATSQAIKRNSDTVVDSITATDINAFPDKSVAEALQRVAGITVSRFAATSDTTHFSAEPSSVIVRGLQQVRSEFNGRDIFNANSGRGLSFADVPPELMAGVDAYKNATADMIEGGVAGTINLRTRLPFDSTKQILAFSADALYGDLARKTTPDFSGVYSNRWTTDLGEFGFLANLAYSRVNTDSQGIQYGRIGQYKDFTAANASATVPNYGQALVFIPSSLSQHDVLYERTRTGGALAAQWRSPDHKILVTGQYNESRYRNVWHEHALESFPGYGFYGQAAEYQCTPTDAACGVNNAEPYPAPGTGAFTFGSDGVFHSGVMTTGIGWWGADNAASSQFAQNSSGQQLVNACYGWNGCNPPKRGADMGTYTRFSDGKESTGDGSINVKWDPTENLHLNFDYQHVHSKVKNYDISAELYSFANVAINQSGLEPPTMTLLPPLNVNLDPGGLSNPSNYAIHDVMDHMENSRGHEDAFRADAEYDFNTTWLNALKVGVRYADREQTVRWSTYNWQNIANEWTSATTCADGTAINQSAYYNVTRGASGCFKGYRPDLTVPGSLSASFYGGGKVTGAATYPFFNYAILENKALIDAALARSRINVGAWDPLCSNTGNRAAEIKGTCYTLSETDQVDEKTGAAYMMLKFGGNDATIFGFRVSGNIGVRYVHTTDDSVGGISIPTNLRQSANQNQCTVNTPNPNAAVQALPYSIGCYLYGGNATQTTTVTNPDGTTTTTTSTVATGLPGSPQETAFANGASLPSTVKNSNDVWLPSFNFKVNLTDTLLARFAVSRTMSRPDIGLIKNYLGVGASLPSASTPVICGPTTTQIACFTSTNGALSGVNGVRPFYTASSYNPALQPIKADQVDVTLENYFAKVGQFSVDAFYKHFENYIQYGQFYRDVTNNGVTRTVQVRGPVNTKGANLYGFETAFQRYFDFLPAPFDGLGVQANFTYVKNSGLENSSVSIVGQPAVTNGGVPNQLNPGTLEALSKYSYNVIGMYEKGPLALRLAYNWRSHFLVTALDCCTYLPMWQRSQGYLDGSIRYKITENMELDFEATNLLNTKTILEQQVTDKSEGLKLIPSSWFQNDRRFQLGVRVKF